MPIGGGKGGSDFNPRGRSESEIMRFCQSFMTELYRHLGEYTDVPAGDIGVGGREIGFMFGQYKRLTNRYEAAVLTGKGLAYGGSRPARRQPATARAISFKTCWRRRPVIRWSARRRFRGGKRRHPRNRENNGVWWTRGSLFDSDGYVVDDSGIDLALLKEIKEVRRARIEDYVRLKGIGAHYIAGGSIWDVQCDVAMPCATQNELTGRDALSLIRNGIIAVGEGANMPCTPEAVRLFQQAGVLFAPGKRQMPAASPLLRWKCSRTRPAIAGHSNKPRRDFPPS